MLFLSSQLELQEQMSRAVRGQEPQLEPGYDALYATWTKEHAEVLYRWSAQERAQSFVDFVGEQVNQKFTQLLQPKNPELASEEEITRMNAARRGALLLVSQDNGKNFDKVMSAEEVNQAKNKLDFRILSSTLASTPLKPEEIVEEQELLQVAENLQEQNFQVESATLENHVIHIRTHHPKMGVQEVKVQTQIEWKVALVYTFVGAKGEQHVLESQLPEFYGEASVQSWESTSIKANLIGQTIVHTQTQKDAQNTEAKALMAAYVASKLMSNEQKKNNARAAILALQQKSQNQAKEEASIKTVQKQHFNAQIKNLNEVRSKESETLDRAMEKERFESSKENLQNVQQSKKDLVARRAREKGELEKEKQRIQERVQKSHEEHFEKIKAMAEKQRDRQLKNKEKERSRRRAAAGGAALASAAFSGMAAAASWSSFLAVIQS